MVGFGARALLAPAALVLSAGASRGDEAPPPKVHIVFFTPADLSPPAGVERRLTQIADTAERFLVRGMTTWKYSPANPKMFQRKADGSVEVLFLKGDQPKSSGKYDRPTFAGEVIDGATKQYKIDGRGHLWWIFIYLGDPPTRFGDYRGHGDSASGGWALVNYDTIPGEIRPEEPLGGGFHEKFTVKGCIHELGHTFGLPHIGPNPGKKLGNSLMGPNMGPFHAKYPRPRDNKVYLTEASAAMLWKHPVFSGTAKDRALLPHVELADYRATFVRAKRRVELNGKLVSNVPAHSVVVLDDAEKKQGSYWVRSYVSRLSDDGTFKVVIDEPFPSDGEYRIVFCFENGAVTGDGKKHGDEGSIVKSYRFVRGVLQFDK